MQPEDPSTEVPTRQGGSLLGFLCLAVGSIVLPNALALWLNSCFRGRLWSELFTRTAVASSPAPGSANPSSVVAPYGVTCDYFPDAWEVLFGNLGMAVIFFMLGYLTLRLVRERTVLSAVGLGCIGTSAQLALTLFAYPDSLRFDVIATDELSAEFVRSIRMDAIQTWLIGCVIASAICAAGAAYALWRRRRATRP